MGKTFSAFFFFNFYSKKEAHSIPEQHGGLYDKTNRVNIKPHSCNPNNTYYIHSCVSRHVTCIEQKSVHSVKVSTMAAICYLPHQVLQHPTQFKKKIKKTQIKIKYQTHIIIKMGNEIEKNQTRTIIRLFLGLISRTAVS